MNWTSWRDGRLKRWSSAPVEYDGRALVLVVGPGAGGWRYDVQVHLNERGRGLRLLAVLETSQPSAVRARTWAAGFLAGLRAALDCAAPPAVPDP